MTYIDLTACAEKPEDAVVVVDDESSHGESDLHGEQIGNCSYCGGILTDVDERSGAVNNCSAVGCPELFCTLCSMAGGCFSSDFTNLCEIHNNRNEQAKAQAMRAMKASFNRTQRALDPDIRLLCDTIDRLCSCSSCSDHISSALGIYFDTYAKHMQEPPRGRRKRARDDAVEGEELDDVEKRQRGGTE